MQRIAIIGNGGGGKSTLARAMARTHGLPLTEVDTVQYGGSWERVDPVQVIGALEAVQATAGWVIDGFGPWPVIAQRLAVADVIVFVDLPVWQHFAWASERQHAHRVAAAAGEASRAPQSTAALFEAIWRVHTELRPRLAVQVEAARDRGATVHHLTSVAAVDELLAEHGGASGDVAPAHPTVSALPDGLTADEVVERLGLQAHPEGGCYRETWRHVPGDGERGAGTAIYFLLRAGEVSRWHRIDAAEIWHHHAGAPLALEISVAEDPRVDAARVERIELGSNLRAGQQPQALVPPHGWQRAWSRGAWTLVGCTVSPAFEFEHFELIDDDAKG